MQPLLALLLLLATSGITHAQKMADFFNSSQLPIDFVGLDFSQARMVGAEGFPDPAKLRDFYFGAWNGMLSAEREKYSLKKAFYKEEVHYHLDVAERVNRDVDYIDLVTDQTPASFTPTALQKMVRRYDTRGLDSKLAVSFIVHSFNKLQKQAYVYVVVFNTKTKRVLFSKRVNGRARGFGVRHYWAGALYDVLQSIQEEKFQRWRRDCEC